MLYQTWDKHDKKDAQVILHLIKSNITQRYYDPLIHQHHDIQELSNTYHQVSKRKTQLQHSLKNHYFTLYFPEAEKHMHSTRANWFISLLLAFPCPQAINALPKAVFIESGCQIKGKKRYKPQWLADFYETAQQSLGLPVAVESETIQMFRSILTEYKALCELRYTIEARAIALLSDRPDFKQLQTIVGVGPIIALTVLAEVGDMRRFAHYKQFLNYCGFNLCSQRSGTLQGQTKLSNP